MWQRTGPASRVRVVGLDLGHETIADADRWLARLAAVPGLVACTHVIAGGHPRVVLSLGAPAEIDLTALPPRPDGPTAIRSDDGAALRAAAAHAERRAGRAVRYPGADALTGVVTVADILATTAIDRIRIHRTDRDAEPDTVVDISEQLRPCWIDTRLTLLTVVRPDGTLAPVDPSGHSDGHQSALSA